MSGLTSKTTVDRWTITTEHSNIIKNISVGINDIPKSYSFFMDNSSEPLLKIDSTGFYVRGERVPQDAQEAETVYNAFHKLITWHTLNRW